MRIVTTIRLKDGVVHRNRHQYDSIEHAVEDAQEMMKEPERYMSIEDDRGAYTVFPCSEISSVRIMKED